MMAAILRKADNLDYLLLPMVLGLAFYIAFIPHTSYPYLLHVDEWVHMARAEALMNAGSTTFPDPLTHGSLMSISSNLEAGYQMFWGIFQTISGMQWTEIFRFFPSVIFVVTVLSVFVMARREGFGLEAAFMACLVPTSIGILGPAFLVPVSMGLLFTPLIVFLALNFRTVWSYALIFVFICFLLSMHAPSAIIPILVLAPYIILNIKSATKHNIILALVLLAPFMVIFPWIISLVINTAVDLFTTSPDASLVQLPRVIQELGYVFLSMSLLGTFVLAHKGGKRNYSIVLGLVAVLAMLAVFYTLNFGLSILYERGLLFMMLLLGIIGGAGLRALRNFSFPKLPGYEIITRHIGKAAWAAVIIAILVINIPAHLGTNYYQMIDEQDYESFVWIRDNVPPEYETAILDPWKATAYAAITQRTTYTRIHSYPLDIDMATYEFLIQGSEDTALLKENGISLVYTRVSSDTGNIEYPSSNPDLEKLAENIYILNSVPENN